MAEWLVEQGIGEERALLIDGDHAVAAAMRWPGSLEAGEVADAILISRARGSSRGTARFPSGEEALASRLPRDAAEGSKLRMEVTRPAISESLRIKRAQARPSDAATRPAPTLAEQLEGRIVYRFPRDYWEEVLDEAWDGIHDFAGGSIFFAPTPAMTLVDVDSTSTGLDGRDLAIAAAKAMGLAIGRMNISGNIGLDFPTLPSRADRKAVDEALEVALANYEHERTAMNGFGFVQIVSRLARPSILHRLQLQPMEAAARLLLRRAEETPLPGAILLTAHPGVLACLRPEWLEELARRTGREIRKQSDPALAPRGSFAQAVVR